MYGNVRGLLVTDVSRALAAGMKQCCGSQVCVCVEEEEEEEKECPACPVSISKHNLLDSS